MAEVRCIVCGKVIEETEFMEEEHGILQGYVHQACDNQKEQEHGTSRIDGVPRGYPCIA